MYAIQRPQSQRQIELVKQNKKKTWSLSLSAKLFVVAAAAF